MDLFVFSPSPNKKKIVCLMYSIPHTHFDKDIHSIAYTIFISE